MVDIYGQMGLSLKVGNTPETQFVLPLNPSLIDEITIIQNNLIKVPIIQMIINEDKRLQENIGLFGDGSKFSVDMHIGGIISDEVLRSHPFRVYSLPEQYITNAGLKIKILGYLDIPKYFRKRYDTVIEGNSFEVIQELAKDNNMGVEATETDDRQYWLPDGRSQADYARYVTNHGWAGDTSCMELAVTQIPTTVSQQDTQGLPWMIRYLDITEKMKGPVDGVFINSPSGNINVPSFYMMDVNIKNHCGFFNHWLGYGDRMGQEELDGSYKEYDKVTIEKISKHLSLNRELKNELGVVRREVSPINCGNTHNHYIQARYQNRRIKSQYATVADVLVMQYTPFRVFDKVEMYLDVPHTNSQSAIFRGVYIVTAKTTIIRGEHYREKFELSGQGSNEDIEGIWT